MTHVELGGTGAGGQGGGLGAGAKRAVTPFGTTCLKIVLYLPFNP